METKNREASSEMMKPDEVGARLRVGRSSVFRLMAEGTLPSLKVRHLRRVRRDDLDRFIEERLTEARR